MKILLYYSQYHRCYIIGNRNRGQYSVDNLHAILIINELPFTNE